MNAVPMMISEVPITLVKRNKIQIYDVIPSFISLQHWGSFFSVFKIFFFDDCIEGEPMKSKRLFYTIIW